MVYNFSLNFASLCNEYQALNELTKSMLVIGSHGDEAKYMGEIDSVFM